jgi:hypothetical protein
MTIALTSIVSCEVLGLVKAFTSNYWGHVISKMCCQYVIDDSKVSIGLTSISIKECLSILQKTITWTKKIGKG